MKACQLLHIFMLDCTNQKLMEKLSQHPITRVYRFLTRGVGFKHSTKRR